MPGALTRWDPFAEFADLRSRFDRMFDEMTNGHERKWTPAIDVVRDNGNLVVRADVPGIKPEDVKIEIEEDVLCELPTTSNCVPSVVSVSRISASH